MLKKELGRHSLLILQSHVAGTLRDLNLLSILFAIPPPDEGQKKQTDAPADNDRDLGGHIARGIFGAEDLRTYTDDAVNFRSDLGQNETDIPMIFPAQ